MDLLVVMDTPNGNLVQMLAVSRFLSPHPFGLDIIVHPASVVAEAVAHGDFFLFDATLPAAQEALAAATRIRAFMRGRLGL